MSLFAERAGLIDTENAFKIGPLIRAIEEQGKEVVKCNLGEPDFPVPEFIKEEVKRQLEGIRCQRPKGAFYVFPNISEVCENLGIMDAFRGLPPDLREKTSPSTLLQMFLLFEYQVATMDRKSFGRVGSEDFHFLRLSFATDTESLREGLRRLSRASQDREGFQRFFNWGEHLY